MFIKSGVERAIISLILSDKKTFYDVVSEGVKPKHFGIKGNNVLYTVINHLVLNEGIETLDSMLIYNAIPEGKTKEYVDELGGLEYIDSLFGTCIFNNIGVYIKSLKEAYKSRKVFDEMSLALEKLKELKPIDEVLTNFDTSVSKLITEDKGSTTYKVGEDASERLRIRKESPKDIYGYSVGWTKFDKISQGMQENDLVIVAGESKTGKSTILTNWAERLCASGLSGTYLDTEMTDEEFDDRILSIVSRVPFEEIRNGKFAQDTDYGNGTDKERMLEEAIEKIKGFNLRHEYVPQFTVELISSIAKQHKKEYNIDFLIFDYIKMPNEDIAKSKNTNEYEKLGYITTCLKDLAGMLKIPVITACQSNRSQLGNTSPDAGSIQGSFKILQMASKLYFIRNKTDYELSSEGYRFGNQVLHIGYQRHGGAGETINIQFDKAICTQRECD